MSEWISVEDRLPEDEGYVLVTDGDYVSIGYKDDSMGVEYMEVEGGSMIAFLDITHWMPIPEPPRSKDNE